MAAETAGAAATGIAGALSRVGAALGRRDFRWWFGSQVLSSSGTMTQGVALSWVVLQTTGNAFWLSIMTVCTWGPTLLLGPWAGSVVDRVDRRLLLIGTQGLLLITGLLLSALSAAGALDLWAILGTSVLAGVVTAADSPARQVYVVDLVGKQALSSAVGLWEVSLNISRVLGPGLGGALLATVGPSACFLVNALSYLPPLYVLWRLVPQDRAHIERSVRGRGAVRSGMAYVWRTPVIRACMPLASAGGMLFTMGIALPVLATRAFHLGGGGYGALMAAFGIGGLPGAVIAAGTTSPTGQRVRTLAACTGGAVVLVAWAPDLFVAFAAMALTGFLSIWFVASANTLVQLRCVPEMRGRVMGLWGMSMTGTVPMTGFLIAAVGQYGGARAGFAMSGFALLAAALLGWRSLSERPEEEQGQEQRNALSTDAHSVKT